MTTRRKEIDTLGSSKEDVDSMLQPFLTSKEMCFLRIQNLYDLSKQVIKQPSIQPSFIARVQDLTNLRKEYDRCVKEVNSISKLYIPNYVPTYSELDTFDELYYAIRAIELSLLPENTSTSDDGLQNDSGKYKRRVKLPELQIPKFDSKLENWITFRDTFLSLIHNNAGLSSIEKFYYLIASVTGGPALVIVKSMPVTADNYMIVWNTLLTRFDNRRALAASYVDKMFACKPFTQESVANLNSFLQTFKENITALEQLKIKDLSSFLLFQIAVRNLDPVTRREFEQTKAPGALPTVQELLDFVEKHSRVLELSTVSKQYNKPDTTKHFKTKPTFTGTAVASGDNAVVERQKSNACPCCQKPHAVYRCPGYNALTPTLRTEKVKQLRLCENCLRDSHVTADCTSKYTCNICKNRHHTSLHVTPPADNVVALTCSAEQTVLLGTAVIHIQDVWGNFHPVRALIDSGAMSSYITQACAKILGLPRRKCNFRPIGLGGNPVRNFGLTTCHIKPLHGTSAELSTDAVVVDNIAGNLPTISLPAEVINKYRHLELADPAFHNCAPVHMLIAGDLFPYIYCGDKIIPERPGLPVALKSIFGYVITGQVNLNQLSEEVNTPGGTAFSGFSSSNDLDQVMNSFWEIESIPSVSHQLKPDDALAESMFASDHSRDPQTGRYIVKYPMRPDHSLGDSRQMALRRLLNLESRLNRDSNLRSEYNKFMAEYESLGHMTCLGEMQNVDSKYLIPHFCIVKPSSTSTKYRCVFDASSRTTNQKSLNDVCLPGPKLQADINVILINFRLHAVCLSADICKCYRQTLIHKDQRPYQHILWRASTDQPIKVYELNTITYGVSSSPYLAIKVLHTLANSEADTYPIAANVLKSGFFMDDLLWSEPNVETALQLQKDLRALLASAGFDLRKWSSNHAELLEAVPEDYRETSIEFEDGLSLSVLGLQWLPASDCFTFKCVPVDHNVTKRTVLSLIGRLFDPQGFVAPCIFFAKHFMQKLWTIPHLEWDTRLPTNLEAEWLSFVKELPLLTRFRHERHVTVPDCTYCRILGFADASSLGYAAVVYLHTKNERNDSKVSLLIAKSKVAPLKTVSIPRLELLAALLLAKLVKYVVPILKERSIIVNEQLLFTDSSVVLAWLNTPSYNLKTFVATRVTKILEIVPSNNFFHVSGEHNSCADVLSRGASPSALLAMPEWLNGPKWLSDEPWPVRSIDEFRDEAVPELKSNESITMVSPSEPSTLIYELTEKYSNYDKLVNVVAWIQKFINNCRKPKHERTKFSLSDAKQARDLIIKSVQQHHFAEDISKLAKGLKPQPSLQKLNPFVDANGFLRVGGRLSLSDLPFDTKHPVLLPKKSNFTNSLIDYYHKLHLHVGPRTLQSILSQKYWIVSARNVIRLRTRKCIACFKVRPTVRQPLMGQLPKFRTQDIHVFHTVAVDIGGPFQTKESIRKNARVHKSYLIIYVCCSTRAVFLDTLTSLSTECFLASFDRFTSRRGLCHTIISDNATNFVSASRHLTEVSQFLQTNADELSRGFTKREVEWKRNPPTGSHFGGLYEAVIRSSKDILKRTTANRTLTFEELTTLFARAEAVLNSRPLFGLSTDPSEYHVISASHFLIGRELLAVPEYDLTTIPTNRLNRWPAVQQMAQHFWRQWRKNFLHTLQERQKWTSGCPNLKVGDLVLIHSDAPPLQWPLGRVTKLHTGIDNVTRVVTVRTKNGEFIRPVVKLSPLPIDEDSM